MKAEQNESYWAFRAPKPPPPPDGYDYDGWESLSPGMRRQIVRDNERKRDLLNWRG